MDEKCLPHPPKRRIIGMREHIAIIENRANLNKITLKIQHLKEGTPLKTPVILEAITIARRIRENQRGTNAKPYPIWYH